MQTLSADGIVKLLNRDWKSRFSIRRLQQYFSASKEQLSAALNLLAQQGRIERWTWKSHVRYRSVLASTPAEDALIAQPRRPITTTKQYTGFPTAIKERLRNVGYYSVGDDPESIRKDFTNART
jgi:hypothetical protein